MRKFSIGALVVSMFFVICIVASAAGPLWHHVDYDGTLGQLSISIWKVENGKQVSQVYTADTHGSDPFKMDITIPGEGEYALNIWGQVNGQDRKVVVPLDYRWNGKTQPGPWSTNIAAALLGSAPAAPAPTAAPEKVAEKPAVKAAEKAEPSTLPKSGFGGGSLPWAPLIVALGIAGFGYYGYRRWAWFTYHRR